MFDRSRLLTDNEAKALGNLFFHRQPLFWIHECKRDARSFTDNLSRSLSTEDGGVRQSLYDTPISRQNEQLATKRWIDGWRDALHDSVWFGQLNAIDSFICIYIVDRAKSLFWYTFRLYIIISI